MKTKRFDFNHRSLVLSHYLEQIGSLPEKQSYDPATSEYAPDYTLAGSHLVFQPHVVVMSEEPGAEHGDVTASANLTNITWTEVTAAAQTVITAANTGYEIATSGANKGRITMKRNVPVGSSLTLVFEADYLDSRKNETHHVRLTKKISCESEGTLPVLSIDRPTTNLWNPFRDPQTMQFNCSLKQGGLEIPTAQRSFVWEKKRDDGSWSTIGTDAQDDFGWTVTNNGSTYTQDMNYIGERQDMRVRAGFGSVAIGTVCEALTVYFTMLRRLPDYEYDFKGVVENVEPDTTMLYPKPVVTDRNGVVTNAMDHLSAEWYLAAGTAGGSPVMQLNQYGADPEIPTSQINQYGMMIGLEMKDLGNFKRVTQDDQLVTQEINGETCVVIAK